MTSVILKTAGRLVQPLVVFFALRLWWTGHYGPGGGFVGGLMVAAALALGALQEGAQMLDRRWDVLMTAGLLLAIGSAIVPLLVGASPLQHAVTYLGPLKIATSLVFDFGVLLLVTGCVMSAIRALVESA